MSWRTARRCCVPVCCSLAFLFGLLTPAPADDSGPVEWLTKLSPDVLPHSTPEETRARQRMLSDDIRSRRDAANRRDREQWNRIQTREEWEAYRDERLSRLRASLGAFPEPPRDLKVRVLKTIDGDGFQIHNLTFESRPGLVVTANLYSPATPTESMPGILLCHSHHRPKVDGELQDMGMIWARAGCLVLVMDQLGHGERRQHPFATEKDFEKPFRVSRQDYYFRYNVGLQLHLIGESQIGWMAWDLMRGVDLLLSRPGIDPKRLILMGAVAGGGDPAAVAGALDARLAAVVPFNFGGPQPESTYPLPADAEMSFNMFGGGSWESTRNLRGSIQGEYPPWLIVGAIAPRRLIYAHEFSWDREHDPVWKRFQTIYGWYESGDRLSFTLGYGRVSLSSKEASHCNHIGATHRKLIYPALERWFGIPAPKEEYSNRRDAAELLCVDSAGAAPAKLTKAHALARLQADEFANVLHRSKEGTETDPSTETLQKHWRAALGGIDVLEDFAVQKLGTDGGGDARIEKFVLRTERQIQVPAMLLTHARDHRNKTPVVVAFAQAGKAGFLQHRSQRIAELLNAGVSVCLVDLRGTGETSVGSSRGRTSEATSASSSELMFGQTPIGSQLRDLRTLLVHLRKHTALDAGRIALWADSFAPVNESEKSVAVPLDAEPQPRVSEPGAQLVALLCGLFEPDVRVIASARGGLVSIASVLDSPFPQIPHDAVIPGCLKAGDLDDLATALWPRAVWLGGLVDGQNLSAERPGQEGQRSLFPRTLRKAQQYVAAPVVIRAGAEPGADFSKWLVEQLKPAR